MKRASDRYWAAAGQDSGTCDALRWQWLSVCPMVVATGDDPEDLLDWAVSLTGHSDIYVHDSQAVEVSP